MFKGLTQAYCMKTFNTQNTDLTHQCLGCNDPVLAKSVAQIYL